MTTTNGNEDEAMMMDSPSSPPGQAAASKAHEIFAQAMSNAAKEQQASVAHNTNNGSDGNDSDKGKEDEAMAEDNPMESNYATNAEAEAEKRHEHGATKKVSFTTANDNGNEKNNEDNGNGDINSQEEEIQDNPTAAAFSNEKLAKVWQFVTSRQKQANNSDNHMDPQEAHALYQKAYTTTLNMISDMLDAIVHDGLHAYHQLEDVQRQLQVAKETIDSKNGELERLRSNEEKQRQTISNLLRAVEKNKTSVKETSQVARVEARMRSELTAMHEQKNGVVAELKDRERQHELCQEELRQTKSKLAKAEQDKVKWERDRRATMSWAKSIDGSLHTGSTNRTDGDYYKRKTAELNSHIQGLNAVIAEKTRQMEEMRRQMDRSMSHNRLANYYRTSDSHGGSSNSNEHVPKKARKRSY